MVFTADVKSPIGGILRGWDAVYTTANRGKSTLWLLLVN
ncbi:hypothetical protein RG47T_0644 [Mucilaginibacter polytrichastri]|uniref:Uncharacterized protein n=1 Tax=Mucilaginibacter polytrichastri TaxID=1302689 RepID=A0A1Q5ZTV6_9SPHI|nr:hypothetical protein RG47T_0644 [Mucilaginibacter polytrichastri]